MNFKKWSLRGALLVAAGLGLAACAQTFKLIAPNEFGMILTPTGFQNDILRPGSYDIGTESQSGQGNKLYLVDGSLIGIKESFVNSQAREDGEDGRCSMQGAQPLTLDVRLTLAIPDVEAEDGPMHLARLMTLSRAETVEDRVFRIDPESVYDNQAQQEVRGKIRQLCASFADFAAAEASFGDNSPEGMTARIETLVQEVLEKHNIPLRLISAQASNMKPDESVIAANAAVNAAEARTDAVRKIVDYLDSDTTGYAWEVYRLQMMQEIAKTGDVMLLDLNSGAAGNILPLPLQTQAPANDDVAPVEESTGTDDN
tara:strand:+ start:487 stop:1428 length:942 start_codon:yes stop_codon:yes gene_type:complete